MNATAKKIPSILRFAFVILISAAGGALFSIGLFRVEGSLHTLTALLANFLAANIITVYLVLSLFIFAIVLLIHHSAKKSIGTLSEDDDCTAEAAGRKLSLATAFTTISNVLVFIFLYMLIYFYSFDKITGIDLSIGTAIAIAVLFLNVYFEVTTVKLIKKITPNLKGDPLKFSFEKEYMQSCDEAERYSIYNASYKSFITLKYAFVITMAALMMLQLVINIGPAAPIAVAILWAIHSITFVSTMRLPK